MKQSSRALKLAGAAALAGSTQAYGQIVTLTPGQLPGNITGTAPAVNASAGTSPVTTENWGVLSGAAGDDFTFAYFNGSYVYPGGSETYLGTGVSSNTGNAIAGAVFSDNFVYALSLAPGTKIGSDNTSLQFPSPTQAYRTAPLSYLVYEANGTTVGYQALNTPAYVGFQFTDSTDEKIHDGWLELESVPYTDPSNPGGLFFLAGAYNSVADTGDGAGDILVPGGVPEPGTISSLVLGAAALAGVGLMRRRRTLATE